MRDFKLMVAGDVIDWPPRTWSKSLIQIMPEQVHNQPMPSCRPQTSGAAISLAHGVLVHDDLNQVLAVVLASGWLIHRASQTNAYIALATRYD